MDRLETLTAELFFSLHLFFAAAPFAEMNLPQVQRLPASELQQRVCGGPCHVMAWYGPDSIIYLDSRLDLDRNVFARSVLVHELTHHVQRHQKGPASGCADWLERERQAFAVQTQWLRANGVRPPPLMQRVASLQCQDRGQDRRKLSHGNAGLGG